MAHLNQESKTIAQDKAQQTRGLNRRLRELSIPVQDFLANARE